MLIIIHFLPSILRKNAGRGCIRNSSDSMWNIRNLFLNIGCVGGYVKREMCAPIICGKVVLGTGSILYN